MLISATAVISSGVCLLVCACIYAIICLSDFSAHMSPCVHLCVHVVLGLCAYIYEYVLCVYVSLSAYICARVYMHVCVYVRMNVCVYALFHMFVCVRVCMFLTI